MRLTVRILTCVLVLAIYTVSFQSVHGVYDPQGTGGKFGKRWIITGDLRAGYDDNVTTAPQNTLDSGFTGVTLSGNYSYPMDSTFSSVRLGGSSLYYYDRPDSAFDYNVSFDGTLSHTFTPRLSVDITDHMRFAQEPQLSENNAIFRRQGDYVSNTLNVGFAYEYSPRWFLDLTINHELWDYKDRITAFDLDRQALGIGPTIRYRMTEKTTLSGNYRFARTDYRDSPRDANTHTTSLEWMQNLTTRWNATVEAGASMREEDNILSKSTFYTPFVSMGSTYLITTKATVSGGLRYSFQETDLNSYFSTRALLAYLRTSWRYTKDLTWDNGIDFVNNEMTDGVTSAFPDVTEKTFVLTEKLTWKVREHVGVFVSYALTSVDSDITTREYDRNILTFGSAVQF